MGLKYSDIEWAFDVTSLSNGMSDVSAVVHVPEGKLYARDAHGFMKFDEELQIPEDAYDNSDYVWVPTKRDLNLGTPLVFQFVEIEIPDAYPQVERMFARKGAYSRFKAFLESKGMLEKWNRFESEETRFALLSWCRDHGITLDDVVELPTRTEFFVSTDRDKLDLPLIHRCLSEDSYWANGRTFDEVATSFGNSMCFGLYNRQNDLLAFCRVITDYISFAYLADLYVLSAFRSQGIATMLLEKVFAHASLKRVCRWMLGTRDAHGLYKKFGFETLNQADVFMQRLKPAISLDESD
ncbi:MAG: GNAT family N-acetyltransferase [Deltaproteobacteria bacterium]|nr:GNAT family N-acetyltransferase [Deltaproteobacteria bacterium]